jgi:dTDP-4-amino-4,6-dideoxygalactose transaminase
MTTGEGGMMTTESDELAQKLGRLRSHGMTTLTWDRHKGHAWSYDVVDLGYNYRIDEIRAALGTVQLKKVERNNERRRQLVHEYRDVLNELVPQVEVPFNDYPGITSAHIMPVLLPGNTIRENFMGRMKAQGVQTSIHYPPIHMFSSFVDDKPKQLSITEEVAHREVTLPLYPMLTNEDILEVAKAVRQALSD